MKIIKPSVKLWLQSNDWKAHVAKCARLCYASNKTDNNEELINRLLDSKHNSMFRHRSLYFIVPSSAFHIKAILEKYNECPYIDYEIDVESIYISTNGQFINEHPSLYHTLKLYEVSSEGFSKCSKGYDLMRYTFNIITQISTSRELNRVSPNSIAEQSTRFCNFNNDKFEGEISICQPHWFDLKQNEVVYCKFEDQILYIKTDNEKDYHKYEDSDVMINECYNHIYKDVMYGSIYLYITNCIYSCMAYNMINNANILPQDARGNLPLDIATNLAYTYSVKEWRRIIDSRYYGTTGKPHHNAKIIASMIREKLIDLGYKFR